MSLMFRQVLAKGCLVAAFVAAGPVILAGTPSTGQGGPSGANAADHGASNFHQVNAQLYRSAHPEPEAFAWFAAQGITTVLSVEDYLGNTATADAERRLVEAAGMHFIWLPMSPIAKPTVDQLEQALGYLETASNQPLLIHCQLGADRTGLVIAAYRLLHDHWTMDEASQELYAFGHSPLLGWWDDVLQNLPGL